MNENMYYGAFNPANNIMPGPGPMMNPGMMGPMFNNYEERINNLEKNLQRLEERIKRLESPYHNENDDVYMI